MLFLFYQLTLVVRLDNGALLGHSLCFSLPAEPQGCCCERSEQQQTCLSYNFPVLLEKLQNLVVRNLNLFFFLFVSIKHLYRELLFKIPNTTVAQPGITQTLQLSSFRRPMSFRNALQHKKLNYIETL